MANLLGDLGKQTAKEADSSREPKVRIVGSESTQQPYTAEERELLRTITRGFLAQDQQTRLLKSLLQCYRISTEGKVHAATKAAMAELIRAQAHLKEQGMDNPSIQEKLGPAQLHTWNAILKCAIEMATGETKELLERYAKQISTVQDYQDTVLVCKIENMHESKHKRLVLQVTEKAREAQIQDGEVELVDTAVLSASSIWPVMLKVVSKDKHWKTLPGVPPMGAMARRAQKLLDSMPDEAELDL